MSLRKWWLISLPAALLLAAGTVAGLWLLSPSTYRATIWLRVRETFIAFPNGGRDYYQNQMRSQVALARSPQVLEGVIRRDGILKLPGLCDAEFPLDWLESRVDVEAVGSSEFVQISFESSDPTVAKRIVRTVAEEHLKVANGDDKQEQVREVIQKLENQTKLVEENLTRAREHVRQLAEEMPEESSQGTRAKEGSNVFDPVDQLQVLQRQWASTVAERRQREAEILAMADVLLGDRQDADAADQQLIERDREAVMLAEDLRTKRDELDAIPPSLRKDKDTASLTWEIKWLERQLEKRVNRLRFEGKALAVREAIANKASTDEKAIGDLVDSRKDVQQMKDRIDKKKQLLATYQNSLRDHSPASRSSLPVVKLEAEIKKDETELAEFSKSLRDAVVESLEHDSVDQVDQMLSTVRRLHSLEDLLESRMHDQATQLREQASQSQEPSLKQEIELELARRDLSREESLHDRIAERILQLKTELGAPSPVSFVGEGPIVSRVPTTSARKMAVIGAAAFCLPFGLAFFWERKLRRLLNPAQLRSEVPLPVLGELAELPARDHFESPGHSVAPDVNYAIYEESVQVLTANFISSDRLSHVRTLAVCSAVSGEGKSSLAAHLAVSLTRVQKEPVLLVDGDLRSPSLHHVFDLPAEPGMVDLLCGRADVGDVVRKVDDDVLLDVIPAGRLSGDPYAVLQHQAVAQALANLKRHYRYVVIDTPPVLSTGEAVTLCKAADGTIVCTMRDVSKLSQVQSCLDRLSTAGAQMLGTVMAGISSRTYRKSYGSYYVESVDENATGA